MEAVLIQFWNCESIHPSNLKNFSGPGNRRSERGRERLLRRIRSFLPRCPAKTQADSSHDSIERVLKRQRQFAMKLIELDSSHDSIERVLKHPPMCASPALSTIDSSHDSIERVLKQARSAWAKASRCDSSHDSIERVLKPRVVGQMVDIRSDYSHDSIERVLKHRNISGSGAYGH